MLVSGVFEPQALPLMTGAISTEVVDPGLSPVNIIHVSDPWKVHVTWNMTGDFVPPLPATGKWHLRVYAESVGPGASAVVSSKDVTVGSVPLVGKTRSYDDNLDVPANALPPGLYRVVTVITIDDGTLPIPNPVPIAAFGEGPVMQFF